MNVPSASAGVSSSQSAAANSSSGADLSGLLGHWNRYYNPSSGFHEDITGTPGSGFNFESTLGDLYSVSVAGTRPLYSCQEVASEFTSLGATCEGQHLNGLLGYIYASQPTTPPTVAIYRCRVLSNNDHFDTPSAECEGAAAVDEEKLGYAIAVVPWNRYDNPSSGFHEDISAAPGSGFNFESTLGDLYSVSVAGTAPLYSCQTGPSEFTSKSATCEGEHLNGLLGYIYASRPTTPPTVAIYRCRVLSNNDHFDTPSAECEGAAAVDEKSWATRSPLSRGTGMTIPRPASTRISRQRQAAASTSSPPSETSIASQLPEPHLCIPARRALRSSLFKKRHLRRGALERPSRLHLCESTDPTPPTVAIYRCRVLSNNDHFDTPSAECEGAAAVDEGKLGFSRSRAEFSGLDVSTSDHDAELPRNHAANATVGTSYSFTFSATGGYGPRSWSLLSGSLPPGISLSASGIVSGTPTSPFEGGPFNIMVSSGGQTVEKAFTISDVWTCDLKRPPLNGALRPGI